jgi:hypothetical protein
MISPISNVIKRDFMTPTALHPDPKLPRGLLKNFYERILETSAEYTGLSSYCIHEDSKDMDSDSPKDVEDLTTFQPSPENADILNRTPLLEHR